MQLFFCSCYNFPSKQSLTDDTMLHHALIIMAEGKHWLFRFLFLIWKKAFTMKTTHQKPCIWTHNPIDYSLIFRNENVFIIFAKPCGNLKTKFPDVPLNLTRTEIFPDVFQNSLTFPDLEIFLFSGASLVCTVVSRGWWLLSK